MATMTSLVALSIDSVLPALSQIGAYLEVTDSRQTHLIVSVFFVGMALGQLFYGKACSGQIIDIFYVCLLIAGPPRWNSSSTNRLR